MPTPGPASPTLLSTFLCLIWSDQKDRRKRDLLQKTKQAELIMAGAPVSQSDRENTWAGGKWYKVPWETKAT